LKLNQQKFRNMKKSLLFVSIIVILSLTTRSFSQGVAISSDPNATPDNSAILDVQSTDKGFLPPRMSTAERNIIISPATGLIVFDTNEESLFLFSGTEWLPLVVGTGSLWQADGDDIFLDNGNVGIGTASPAALLHTRGTGTGQGNILFEGEAKSLMPATFGPPPASGPGTRLMWYPDKVAFRVGLVTGSAWDSTFIGPNSYAFGLNTMASGNSSVAFGRETYAPSYTEMAIGAYNTIYTPQGTGLFSWNGADRLFVVGNGTAEHLRSDALVLLKNGSLGLGTSFPQSTLHVDGSMRYEDGNQADGKVLTSDEFGNAFWADASMATENDPVFIASPAAGIAASDIDNWNDAFSWGDHNQASYLTVENDPKIATVQTGSVPRWNGAELEDGGIYSQDGNLGIGTNDPLFPLHVTTDESTTFSAIRGEHLSNSGINAGGMFVNNSTGGYGIYTVSNALSGLTYGAYFQNSSTSGRAVNGIALATSGTTYGGLFQSNSTSGRAVYGIATANSGETYGGYFQSNSPNGRAVYALAFSTSGAAYAVWGHVNTPDGYAGYFTGQIGSRNYFERPVGIGTQNPSEVLEVNGNIHVSGGNRTIYNRSNNSLAFGTNNTERMIITSGGNVGIGTSTPGVRLEVDGNIHVSGGNRTIYNRSNNSLAFGTNNTERMRISNIGYVGLGTTNPTAPLHITDFVATIKLGTNASFNKARLTFEDSANEDSYIEKLDGGKLRFRVGGTSTRMTITADGHVGINTQNPLHFHLAVAGEAAKTSGGGWSVFSDARLKHSIAPLPSGTLDRLLQLHGYTFEYTPEAIETRMAVNGRHRGLLAQEVQEVFPDWVKPDQDGYLYVTERGLTAIIVEALRELRAEKDAEIAGLKLENEKLRSEKTAADEIISARIQILEARLDKLHNQQQSVQLSEN
jgi:hypothetical protein